mmetsp:Transcript_72408/g.205221  ORF Transcript_72408/g.205221 Transcript_72408/m.205221 type:complete len:215 (+) Transcript_72408:406-1050(+)
MRSSHSPRTRASTHHLCRQKDRIACCGSGPSMITASQSIPAPSPPNLQSSTAWSGCSPPRAAAGNHPAERCPGQSEACCAWGSKYFRRLKSLDRHEPDPENLPKADTESPSSRPWLPPQVDKISEARSDQPVEALRDPPPREGLNSPAPGGARLLCAASSAALHPGAHGVSAPEWSWVPAATVEDSAVLIVLADRSPFHTLHPAPAGGGAAPIW